MIIYFFFGLRGDFVYGNRTYLRSDAAEVCIRVGIVSRHSTVCDSHGIKWSTVTTKLTATKAVEKQYASTLS